MYPLNIMRAFTAATAAMFLPGWPCFAQTPAEFYKDKNVQIYIGSSVGGVYDIYSRMLAKHMGKYIPGNPVIIPMQMEGAGSMRLANFLYNAAPRDGTAFGTINRGTAFAPLLGVKGAQFEATKFNWIGSMNNEVSVCVAAHTSGITKFEQVRTKELVVGATGRSADTYQFPKVANGVLGTKFKIITGFPGGNDVVMAMERGEVDGRCAWSWTSIKVSHQKWLDQKKINILFQMGLTKHADLPNVPLIMDFAKTDEEQSALKLVFARQVMALPFLAPPGVPTERIDVLRQAFMDTMKDKEFLAEAEKRGLEVSLVSGTDLQKLVVELYDTPAAVIQRVTTMLQ